jgi:hypothetical protein
VEHDVPALNRALRLAERRVNGRRLDHAGDERGLADAQVRHVLAEEQPRRLRYAVNRKRSPLAEIHLVQVQLEDLVLRRLLLEDEGHEPLEHLAPHRPSPRRLFDGHLVGEEEVPGELLRDGAAADHVRLVAEHVGEHRADGRDWIDAGVRVEPLILGRDHRFLHPLRNFRQRHAAPLLASGGHQCREQGGVQLQGIGLAAADDLELSDSCRHRGRALRRALDRRRRIELHADHLALEVSAARRQRNRIPPDRKLAGLFDASPVRVAQIVEPRDELELGDGLPAAQFHRSREDARQRALPLAMQARIDHPRERDVVVGEDRRGQHDERAEGVQGEADPPAVDFEA